MSVTLSAIPANGYVFSGWFASAAATGTADSTSSSYTITVATTLTLYAKFVQDSDAIYKWQGDSVNKMLSWRSKRYVATKPFNPVCAKVFSGVYPAALNLFMSGPPDSPSLTPTVAVSARNQNGFRLPMARPEKYMEIEVQVSGEVTEVVVSTSMGGLA